MNLRGQKRREFPAMVRRAAFRRCCRDGVPHCETCGAVLSRRTGIIYEHVQPDGLGGEPTLENCKVHCKNCADVKTRTEDNPRMVKADRVLRSEYKLGPARQKIKSRGFAKASPQRNASRPIRRKWTTASEADHA